MGMIKQWQNDRAPVIGFRIAPDRRDQKCDRERDHSEPQSTQRVVRKQSYEPFSCITGASREHVHTTWIVRECFRHLELNSRSVEFPTFGTPPFSCQSHWNKQFFSEDAGRSAPCVASGMPRPV